tara:strand:- start:2016 stop:3353 length:1338 start_codon:yes stop_codon:yes gene_type:complete
MAELENNLETTEEVVETIEEGQQPDSKSEKGDKKPVKQGSSDAESIEAGKAEVVPVETNPVDKAVKAVKDAEKKVPSNEGDPQKKGAGKAEKQEKIKEDAKPSKMESIKAIVNVMKEMTKDELQSVLSTISESEEDDSLTKAEVARAVVESLKTMDEDKVGEILESLSKEEETEVVSEESEEDAVAEEVSADVESSLVEIEIDDDLSAISEALDLSEENSEKAKTIFKAAVQSKVAEIKEELDAKYQEELKTTVETVKDDLSEAVDKYLTYCAEEWTKENELAIERGLRSEMTENFIEGLKTLFVEHYVDVPEDKYDVIDELANRLEEMEAKLDGEVSNNMAITEELDGLKRQNVVSEASKDLTDTQKEKLSSLAEGVDFKDTEDFAEKVSELKEAYFKVDGEKVEAETNIQEGANEFEVEETEKVVSAEMEKYSSAITKLNPLG